MYSFETQYSHYWKMLSSLIFSFFFWCRNTASKNKSLKIRKIKSFFFPHHGPTTVYIETRDGTEDYSNCFIVRKTFWSQATMSLSNLIRRPYRPFGVCAKTLTYHWSGLFHDFHLEKSLYSSWIFHLKIRQKISM